ncbi:trehalose-phosphatase [Arthrobacter sp. Br18]|uniref:trehalose-phosphatase n=1 Tax=Arthrobacter sp. Br18 TaxID=1312954 RepID=UPI00047B98E4|nr:trehalose-phosphatase [Arthrobacter sp. Br18]
MTGVIEGALGRALQTLAATEHLLVALDFDGTMSPLVERAGDARSLAGSAAALQALAALPRTTTALISGRAIDSLRLVAEPGPDTLLIGSHGAETWTGVGGEPLTLTDDQRSLLEASTAALQQVADAHPGTWSEFKPAGVVLHTRSADADVARAAVDAARAGLAALAGLHITVGKQVLEVSVIEADKGDGLNRLRSFTGATAVFFAGDDVTDEHAQRVLGPQDVGVKVGDGDSAAQHRVSSPAALTAVLEELLAMRSSGASR